MVRYVHVWTDVLKSGWFILLYSKRVCCRSLWQRGRVVQSQRKTRTGMKTRCTSTDMMRLVEFT